MNARKLASIAGVALGLSMAAGTAQSSLWSFQDDDIDFIVRANPTSGALQAIQAGTLTVGDIFVSVFEMGSFFINGVNAIPAGKELTGVAAVQLVAVNGAGGAGTQYVYAPYTGGLDAILALGGAASCGTACAAGGGAMVAMYMNGTTGGELNLDLDRSSNPATNCTSLANCISEGAMPTLFQVDGFAGDPDEFWVASQILPGGGDIGTVLGTNNAILVAGFNAGLSTFFNVQTPVGFVNVNTGNECVGVKNYVADGCVQLFLSGTITGGQGLTNGAIAHSDTDAQKYVPEPGTLALFGAGLMALAGLRRRQSKAA